MKYLVSLIFILLFTLTVNAADVSVGNSSSSLSGKTLLTTADVGTASARNAEDSLTNGSNLPDGAAIIAYLSANYQSILNGSYNVDNDDCTGHQGEFWWDSTDNQWEFCNANSGLPIVVGTGSAGTEGDSMVYPSGSGIPIIVDGVSWGTTITNLSGLFGQISDEGTGVETALGNNANASGGFLTYGNAAVTASILTGYSSGAGTVAGTDTILQAINKLNGNDALKLPLSGGTLTGNVLLDDGTGASPSFTFQDGTDETATFSKADSGYLTLTTPASDGFNILTGNFKVGNGTPGQTINGEDGYIEGLLEVDGMIYADGGVSVAATATGGQYSFLLEDTDNGTNYGGFGIYGDLAHNTIYALPLAAPAAGQVMSFAAPGNQTMSDGSTQSISVGTNVYKDAAQTPVIDDPDNFAANFTGANLYGGTFIANAAGTIVLPEATSGMNFTVILEGANATIIDPLGTGTADTIYMNGLAAAQDENITSSTSGAMCIFQYRSADTWMATCNGFAEATPP